MEENNMKRNLDYMELFEAEKQFRIDPQPFTDDAEKMRDFYFLTKDEFLASYSYLTEEEYDATAKIAYFLSNPLFLLDKCKKLEQLAQEIGRQDLLELAQDIKVTAEIIIFPEE
jgi:hypothetical protein